MSLNAQGTAERMEMVQVDGRKLRTPSEVYKYALVKFLVEHLVGIYIMSPGHSRYRGTRHQCFFQDVPFSLSL